MLYPCEKLNKSYHTILLLDVELSKLEIEHELARLYDGYIIYYPNKHDRVGDVIEHHGSYGNEYDLLEAYGFQECNDDVLGCLTIEKALELFKKAEGV